MYTALKRFLFRVPAVSSEDRRQHLDQVQSVVTRMASASSTAKAWLLPVATAAYGYALVEGEDAVALLGVAAVFMFAVLDASYLRQERAFRALYQAAVEGKVGVYNMNASRFYSRPNGDDEDRRSVNCEWNQIIWSWSLAGFYVPLAVIGALLMLGIVFTPA